jgi:hypothetical protein
MRQCKHNLLLCDRASWQILIIKPTRCTNFSNLFWNETLHISDNSSAHHHEFFTVHTAMVSGLQTCMTYVIAVCTVKNSWWWAKELSETCRALFQNKFEKLVHLVDFIVRQGKLFSYVTADVQYRMVHLKLTRNQFHNCYTFGNRESKFCQDRARNMKADTSNS